MVLWSTFQSVFGPFVGVAVGATLAVGVVGPKDREKASPKIATTQRTTKGIATFGCFTKNETIAITPLTMDTTSAMVSNVERKVCMLNT
jgi:hypothetical protein